MPLNEPKQAASGAGACRLGRPVGRLYPKRADWKHDVHAYECYTCDQRGTAPLRNKQCQGCINRPTRPHWKPHPDYAAAAQRVILLASGKPPNAREPEFECPGEQSICTNPRGCACVPDSEPPNV